MNDELPTLVDGALDDMMTSEALGQLALSCPRLPRVFSVLLCGHQPDYYSTPDPMPLRKCIQSLLTEALAYAKEAFDSFASLYDLSPPRLRMVIAGCASAEVSSLTTAAQELSAELIVISPGSPHTTEPMTGASLVCFDMPSDMDASAVEMANGARDLLALAHADLVIATWDSTRQTMRDGAMGLIHQAVLACKPVVWIEVRDNLSIELHLLDRASLLDRRLLPLHAPETLADYLRNCFGGFDPASLRREVVLQLAPRVGAAEELRPSDINDLIVARLPGRIWQERSGALDACLWSVVGLQGGRASLEMLRLVAGKAGLNLRHRLRAAMHAARAGRGDAVRGVWRATGLALQRVWIAFSNEGSAMELPSDEEPDPMFAWMDAMATFTAGRHRAAIWLLNIFAAVSVLLAVRGYTYQPQALGVEIAPTIELLLLVMILLLLWLAFDRRWHRRWLYCRAVAEQLRTQHMLAALLSMPPAATQSPWRHGKDGLVLVDASAWLVQRWLIGLGFAQRGGKPRLLRLDDLDVRLLRCTLDQQVGWLLGKRRDLERQHRNMERLSVGLFVCAIFAVIAHLANYESSLVLFATTVGPAAGAAVASILNHTEVRRVAQAYGRVAHRLHDISEAAVDEAERAAYAEEDRPRRWWHLMQVRRLGIEAALVMAQENQSWHDLLSSRAPTLPA